mmetsp:Transcript_26785/g.83363  ORF Transcript_26785/g.83363 Transcript_26785/m.83363 type:complete len:215 (-) Transcript_26785:45-689(-)
MRRATRRATIAAAAFFAPASALLAPGLPQLDLFLDMRMTIRNPTDALEAIKSTPDGLIMWESPVAPDWGDALDGLDVLAVDPGSRNVEGLPAVRKGRDVALFEPPFDAETLILACAPGKTLLLDSTADVWTDETLPLVEILAAAAADTARVLVSLYDTTMLSACAEKLVLGSLTGAALPTLGAAPVEAGAGGLGVALPPDPKLWKMARDYNRGV